MAKVELASQAINLSTSDCIECGCCFADVNFSDVTACTAGCIFCKSCLQRSVKEVVFGQAPIKLYRPDDTQDLDPDCGAGMGIRCLSIEGCRAAFSDSELRRCLPQQLYQPLERRIAQEILRTLQMPGTKQDNFRIIHCPFCPYAETQTVPSFGQLLTITSPPTLVSCAVTFLILAGLYFAWIVSNLFLVDLLTINSPSLQECKTSSTKSGDQPIYIVTNPLEGWLEISNRLQSSLDRVSTKRNGTVFRCRNKSLKQANFNLDPRAPVQLYSALPPSPVSSAHALANSLMECGRSSCLLCGKLHYAGHACSDSLEGLRLAMETAASNAVKRQCPECGLSFIKLDGCNKVICRCGKHVIFIIGRKLSFTPDVQGMPCASFVGKASAQSDMPISANIPEIHVSVI